MENFTPYSALIGGLLIGAAAALTLYSNGRIAGISGILSGILVPKGADALWRIIFILGLLAGSLFAGLISADAVAVEIQTTPLLTILAGLLVGFGTRLGSGCTSGHGICGLARFSRRSFTATLLFMTTAIVTVYLTRHLLGVI
jgi:uncharacterized membrane protein YedE/YeeE